MNSGHASMQDEEDGFITLGFYVCVALRLVITTKQAMANLLFQVPELCQRKACVTGAVNMVKLKR